jgi:rod shape determining protein RodA
MKSISRPLSILPTLSEEKPRFRVLSSVDGGLVLAALLLACVGLATVHSASSEMVTDFLPRQLAWVGLGVALLLLAMAIDYHVLLDFSLVLYIAAILALAAVLVFGVKRGGARCWFELGPWQVQPSEFAKLATALFLARFLAGLNRRVLDLKQIAAAVLLVLLPMLLVVVEPALGVAFIFVPMLAGMLLISGVRVRVLVVSALLVLVFGVGLWSFGMRAYQRQRVMTFLQPDNDPLGAGYQVRQSKIAVGSGELVGKGYMQGTQSQLRFLPARHTDFILSVLAEEWGFLGVAAVIGLYILYIVSAARVAMRARDRAGILLVVGLLSVFCFHVLYNSSMVVGFLPVTGIPLPFISYGGSFTLFNFLATGMILGVDLRRYVNR